MKNQLLDRLSTLTILEITEEMVNLAQTYVSHGLIPQKYLDDAIHIACASISRLDALVSWNFQHMVRVKTRVGVRGLNTLYGFPVIEIITPEEVIYDFTNS